MITMQDLIERFKPILNNVEDKKEVTKRGIGIPYHNLAQICVEFRGGECYSFFGGSEENALWMWRINLLWQLAKEGVPVHILEGGKDFDRDFYDLLSLQSATDRMHLRSGYFSIQEYLKMDLALEKLAHYPITWHTDYEDIPTGDKPSVCMQTISLEEWQNPAPWLWADEKDCNKVIFLFVQLPKGEPVCWNSIYARDKVVLPEYFNSYIGFVGSEKTLGFGLHSPRKELHLNIRKMDFLGTGNCRFNYDGSTGKITPL